MHGGQKAPAIRGKLSSGALFGRCRLVRKKGRHAPAGIVGGVHVVVSWQRLLYTAASLGNGDHELGTRARGRADDLTGVAAILPIPGLWI